MRKQEVINIMRVNDVQESRFKTFVNSTAGRKIFKGKSDLYKDQVLRWLIADEKKQIEESIKAGNRKKAKEIGVSVKELERLKNKASKILGHIFSDYSCGDHKKLFISKKGESPILILNRSNTTRYSGKYRGSERYGAINIVLSLTELRRIRNIGGLWTIPLKNNRCKYIYQCGAKQHYYWKFKKSYLVGESHAETLEEARALETAKAIGRLSEKAKENVFVGVQHIRSMGACMMGIRAYARRHNLNLKHGYTLGFLKSLENSPYLNRI